MQLKNKLSTSVLAILLASCVSAPQASTIIHCPPYLRCDGHTIDTCTDIPTPEYFQLASAQYPLITGTYIAITVLTAVKDVRAMVSCTYASADNPNITFNIVGRPGLLYFPDLTSGSGWSGIYERATCNLTTSKCDIYFGH